MTAARSQQVSTSCCFLIQHSPQSSGNTVLHGGLLLRIQTTTTVLFLSHVLDCGSLGKLN